MIDLDHLLPLLRCPDCRIGMLKVFLEAADIQCRNCAASYPVVHGRPVLLRHDNTVFCLDNYRSASPLRTSGATRGWASYIPTPSVNLASERMLRRVRELISQRQEAAVLVVG